MKNRTDRVSEVLKQLQTNTPDVDGALLVSMDGLALASAISAEADEDSLAAMTAALLGLSERTVEELKKGNLTQVMVKGDEGYVILTNAGPEAVLCITTGSKAKLGIIFLDANRAAKELEKLI